MQFEWKSEYTLNIKIIDYQHQQYIKLVNDLAPQLNNVHPDPLVVDEVFKEINNYIQFHFRTEEKYFDQFHYIDAKPHILEHRKFAKKIQSLKTKFKNDDVTSKFDLIDYLSMWLIHHIYNVDKKYVDLFHQHGLK